MQPKYFLFLLLCHIAAYKTPCQSILKTKRWDHVQGRIINLAKQETIKGSRQVGIRPKDSVWQLIYANVVNSKFVW